MLFVKSQKETVIEEKENILQRWEEQIREHFHDNRGNKSIMYIKKTGKK